MWYDMKPYFLELSILSVRGVTFALTMKKSEQFTCQHEKKLMLALPLAAKVIYQTLLTRANMISPP